MDVTHEFSSSARNRSSIVGSFRFFNFIELGAGVHVVGPPRAEPDATATTSAFPVFRLGINAELDARRRFAFPFSVDMGGGGDVAFYCRLDWGFRVRITHEWFVGFYAFQPTYMKYKDNRGPVTAPTWSFPSGVETGFAF
jgi:hypothetical protein